MNKLISILTPVYNAEKHLERCIRSLAAQTYPYFELILIDDGSSDGSLDICRAWEKTDKRIFVIHQENQGASAARNVGLQQAKGEYLTFVDADDYVEPDYLLSLYQECVQGADITICGNFDEDETGRVLRKVTRVQEKKVAVDIRFDFCGYFQHTVVWGAMYSKKVINGVSFDRQLSIGEDTLFYAEALKNSAEISLRPECLYHYVFYNQSVSHGRITEKNLSELQAWTQIIDLFDDWSISKKSCINAFSSRIINQLKQTLLQENKAVFFKLTEMIHTHMWLLKKASWKNKTLIWLFTRHPDNTAWLVKLLHRR